MKLLILDNYDSFTYNLVHYCEQFCDHVEIFRNDEISIEKVNEYDKILLSPGPGLPKDAGILIDLIIEYSSSKSILGVCLGMQAIAEAFGGELYNLDQVLHGVTSKCQVINDHSIFNELPKEFTIGHYHSWVIEDEKLPQGLAITVQNEDGLAMAIRHHEFDLHGVQFHPESILTEGGIKIIENFLKG